MKVKKMLCGTLACTMLVSQAPVANSGWGYVSVVEAATAKVGVSKGKVSVKQGNATTVKMVGLKKLDKVKWSASNKNVSLKVSKDTQSVTVTGKKVGSVTLTASVGKKQYTSKVTVTSAVSLSATSKTLTKGQSFNLTLTGGNKYAVWKASNKNVTIKKVSSNKYKVTAKKAGSAYVDVSLNGKKYRCKVTVKNPVTISKSKVSVKYGKTYTLSLRNATGKISWAVKKGSSNVTLRIAKNGKCTVVPKRVGSATVQASNAGKKYTCKVTVKAVSKPKLTKSTITVDTGKTATIKLSGVKYSTKTTYTSSDTKVATVTKKGVVKGVKTGTAKITVYADGVKLVQKVFVKGKSADTTVPGGTTVPPAPGDGKNPVTPGETIPDETEKPSTPSKPTDVVEEPVQSETTKLPDISNQPDTSKQTEATTPSTNPSTPDKPEESETNGGGDIVVDPGNNEETDPDNGGETDPDSGNTPGGDTGDNGGTPPLTPVDVTKYDISECPRTKSISGGNFYTYDVYTDEPLSDLSFVTTTGNTLVYQIFEQTASDGSRAVSAKVYGVEKGNDTLFIYAKGTLLKRCSITVTSTDIKRSSYITWLKEIWETCGYMDASLSDCKKIENLGNYILNHFDYSFDQKATFQKDSAGNCNESARVLVDAAKLLGLDAQQVYSPNVTSWGHTVALVTFRDGSQYKVDAGSTGTRGNRGVVHMFEVS